MTMQEKYELRQLAKRGYSIFEIKNMVQCSIATIRRYVKIFGNKKDK